MLMLLLALIILFFLSFPFPSLLLYADIWKPLGPCAPFTMILLLFLLSIIHCYDMLVYADRMLPHKHASPAFKAHEFSPPSSLGSLQLRRRQTTSRVTTCGFSSGDPTQPRTAQPGFDCRIDTANALWGFCPTTVISASDCGLAGNCVDSFDCLSGCGIFNNPKLTTFTWYTRHNMLGRT